MQTVAAFLSLILLAAPPSPMALQEKERGDRLAANGDVAGAREAYENSARLSPGYAAPMNELGILLVNQDKKDEAVQQFRKAVAADSGFALAYNNLGFVLRKLARWTEAIEAYKSYVKLEPSDAAGLFGLAEAYKGAGDKANALTTYEQYVFADQDPKNQKRVDKARAAADQLRRELGAAAPAQPAVAQPAATQPAAAQPTASGNPAAYAAQALPGGTGAPAATAQPVQPAAATASAPAPMQVSPERQALSRQKVDEGLQLRSAGRTRDSLFALQDAANADPGNVVALFELGIAYAMMNYYPQAIERWQRVVALATDDATRNAAQQNIDRARQKMAGMGTPAAQPAATTAPASNPAAQPATAAGAATPATTQPAQPAQAAQAQPVQQQQAAPEPQPSALSPEAQQAYTQGVALYTQQRFAEALAQFSLAIQAKSDFAQAFAARGSANFALRDFQRALNDYAQAMRLDSAMASPVFGVAEALNALGRRSEAVPYYQAYAVSRAPDAQPALQDTARQRIAELTR